MNRDACSEPPATITVGQAPHAEVFNVSKALLCNSSEYFAAALNGAFIEGQTQKIELEDEDPTTFRTYVAWLLQGYLNSQDIERALQGSQSFDQHIAELIIFADKRSAPRLANDAISMLLSYMHKIGSVTVEVVDCIYKNLPNSKEIGGLRRLLTEQEARHGLLVQESMQKWHRDFMADIIKIYKSTPLHFGDSMLSNIASGGAELCKLVHMHVDQNQPCSSMTKNTYLPTASQTQQLPNKKQKTRTTMPIINLSNNDPSNNDLADN